MNEYSNSSFIGLMMMMTQEMGGNVYSCSKVIDVYCFIILMLSINY